MSEEHFVPHDPRFQDPYGAPMAAAELLPYSGLGVASFVLSLLAGFGSIVVIFLAVLLAGEDPDAIPDDDPQLVIVGLCGLGAVLLCVLSIILGAASLFQADRRKLFGILGLLLSFLTVLLFGGLLVIGSLA